MRHTYHCTLNFFINGPFIQRPGYHPFTRHLRCTNHSPRTVLLYEDLRIRLTYHSNAIEGNTLTLRETQVVIEEGITIGGHSLREHLEATNHARAFDELIRLVDQSTSITLDTILRLHALVLHDIHDTAGQFRQTQVYIRGSEHRPPPANQVPEFIPTPSAPNH